MRSCVTWLVVGAQPVLLRCDLDASGRDESLVSLETCVTCICLKILSPCVVCGLAIGSSAEGQDWQLFFPCKYLLMSE